MCVRLNLENGYTDLNQICLAYSLRSGRDFRKVKTGENLLSSNPFEEVNAAPKLSTIEERREDQSSGLTGNITGTKTTTPKTCPGFRGT
jgi:hypothetical protein